MNYYERPEVGNSTLSAFTSLGATRFKFMSDSGEEFDTIKMKKGRAFHCYTIEKDDFPQRYKVHDFEYPTSDNQRRFAKLFLDIPGEISTGEAAYLAMQQTYKRPTAEAAIKLYDQLLPYIQYVEWTRDGIPVISKREFSSIENAYNKIQADPYVRRELFEVGKDEEVHYELEIYWTHDAFPGITFKSKLDCVKINHALKVVKVIDLKSTENAAESQFRFTTKRFKIHKQVSFYMEAISFFLLENNLMDYEIDHRVIAVELKEPYISNVFKFTRDELFDGRTMWLREASDLEWHIKNNIWVSREMHEKGFIAIDKFRIDSPPIIREDEIE